jgi:hypothetical protein
VTEGALVEPFIAGEERGPGELVELGDDRVIRESLASHILANLAHRDPPPAQELPLMLWDILIEQIHPATSSRSWASKASRARRTASAMASLLTSPR